MRRFRSPHRRADHVDDAPCGAYGTRWRHRPCEGCTGQRTRQSRSVGVRTGSPRAEHEHDGGDEDEGNVPEQVERHYGAGPSPPGAPPDAPQRPPTPAATAAASPSARPAAAAAPRLGATAAAARRREAHRRRRGAAQSPRAHRRGEPGSAVSPSRET
jgi:hypothetical protein